LNPNQAGITLTLKSIILQPNVSQTLYNNDSISHENPEYTITIDRLGINLISTDNNKGLSMIDLISRYEQKDDYIVVNSYIVLKQIWDYRNKYNQKNTAYSYVLGIYYDQIHIGYLFLGSNKYNCTELTKLEFINKVYYMYNWQYLYEQVTSALNLKLHGISYLEIAFDSYSKYDLFASYYGESNKNKKSRFNHVGRSKIHTNDNCSVYIIGKLKTTGKCIAIYDKLREITEHSKKYYIIDFYKANNMDIKKGIQRVEVRMDNQFLKGRVTLEELFTQAGLELIFERYTKDSLSFQDLHSKRYSQSRNVVYTTYQLIDYTSFSQREVRKPNKSLSTMHQLSPTKIKSTFRTLVEQYITRGRPTTLEELKHFISEPANTLVTYSYKIQINQVELEEKNTEEFRRVLKTWLKKYHSPVICKEEEERKSQIENLIFKTQHESNLQIAS
jgi:hypothetical protein